MKRHLFRRLLAALLLLLAGTAFAARTPDPAAAPAAPAATTAPDNSQTASRTLKILAVGNSFSQDAVEQYLWELFDAAGIDAVIGNLFIGGCTLERHRDNARSGDGAYRYRKIVDGVRTETPNVSLDRALNDEAWDIVTLQQASGKSGRYATYQPYLRDLIEHVGRLVHNPALQI